MLVDLAGPKLPFRVVSLLHLDAELKQHPDLLSGQIVLVGMTANIGHDTRAVTIAAGDQTALPGVLIHAYAIRDILAGKVVGRVMPHLDALWILLFGLTLLATLHFVPAPSKLLVYLLLVGTQLGLAFWLYMSRGIWVNCAVPVFLSATLIVEWNWFRVLASKRFHEQREALLASYVDRLGGKRIPPVDADEMAGRIAQIRSVLSQPTAQAIEQLQAALPPGGPVPTELAWGLALAFLTQKKVSLAAAHLAEIEQSNLPLDTVYELAVAFEVCGAISESMRLLQRILALDQTYRDAGERYRRLVELDQQVPESVRMALAPRYTDIELLGSGGMARIYTATDTDNGQKVAVKIPGENLIGNPVARQRFRREIQALAALHHPNLVQIRDISLESTPPFYTMDLMSGENLTTMIGSRGRLTEKEALGIMLPIASALAESHAHGIIHRDLKPGNILFDGNGVARLTDFGVAHIEDQTRMTHTSASVGTPAYMAPEQLEGQRPTARIDIYSFGLILYEMLTGNNPYLDGPSTRKLTEDLPELRMLHPEISEAVEALVKTCLARAPEERPADGAALLSALRPLTAPLRSAVDTGGDGDSPTLP
jgi:hypothetical protein